jgi:hypothetical protein
LPITDSLELDAEFVLLVDAVAANRFVSRGHREVVAHAAERAFKIALQQTVENRTGMLAGIRRTRLDAEPLQVGAAEVGQRLSLVIELQPRRNPVGRAQAFGAAE